MKTKISFLVIACVLLLLTPPSFVEGKARSEGLSSVYSF